MGHAAFTIGGAFMQKESRNLALFLDGTWNTNDDNTNVWRLKSLSENSAAQVCYYSAGVGTERGEQVLGGMFGRGLGDDVVAAYKWLIENYEDGDRIYLFGFSRGAFTARSLSGLISKCGLLKQGSPISVKQLYDRYRKGHAEETIRTLLEPGCESTSVEDRWLVKYSRAIDIHFLGVWDTVGSLGIPFGNIPGISRSRYQFLETDLRINNMHAFHALAIDEHRAAFSPTLWTRTEGVTPNPNYRVRGVSSVEQRWFIGAHANVGGGYANDVLAQLPLRWMMRKSKECGLLLKGELEIDGDEKTCGIDDSFTSFASGAYRVARFGRRHYRTIGKATEELSPGQFTTPINETIDESVFDRWRADAKYRPPNLVDWAGRKKVEPAELSVSVRADDPSVNVSAQVPLASP